jgi:hypothetical protein
MYSGDQAWRPTLLDLGHDDYFRHANKGCLDIAQSAFMDPTVPNAVLPAGWPKP